METTTVIAERAPVGVQLWPTRTPEQADAFTLERVATVRSDLSEWVEWTYQNGSKRTFRVGEEVAVQYPPAPDLECDECGFLTSSWSGHTAGEWCQMQCGGAFRVIT